MTDKSSHRQILRSTAIIGGASVINILIGLLRMKAVAILLGPAGVGLIGILQNMVAAASSVSALGFGNVGTRQIAEANGREDQTAVDAARRALFWGTLVLAAIGGVIFWSLRDVLADKILDDASFASTVGWLALGVALTVAAGSQQALLTGMRRIGDMARVTVLSSLLSTLLGIPLILWLGSEGLIWFILATPLSSFLISYLFVSRLPRIISAPTPVSVLAGQWRTLVRLGSAFMLAGLVMIAGQLAVRSMVQRELGAEQLGYFQASWAISMTYIGFVLTAMGTDYYPRLTALINDHEKVNKLVNEQTEVAILLAGPVLLAMLALAPWVITLLYSAEFAPAADVLRLQILGDVLKIVSWPLGFVILAVGAGKTYVVTETLAVGAFVVATWLLMPEYGIKATGLAFLFMYVIYLPVVYFLAYRRTGFVWNIKVVSSFSILLVFLLSLFVVGELFPGSEAALGLVLAACFGLRTLYKIALLTDGRGPASRLIKKLNKVVNGRSS